MLAQTLPRESVIPNLDTALNPSAMKPVFQQWLAGERGLEVESCTIERIKYKPGKNCLVCYRLQVLGTNPLQTHELRLGARFYEAGGSLSRYQKAARRLNGGRAAGLSREGVMPPLIHLPDLDCVIWVFPHDRKLTSLPLLSSPSMLASDVLPELVRHHWGNQWRFSEVEAELQHYLPEHSACVRVALTLIHSETGAVQTPVMYGKTYYNDQGARTLAAMEQLWCCPARQQGRLAIPKPIVYQPRYRLLWQHAVAGRPLLALLKENPANSQRMTEVAVNVATLHHTRIGISGHIGIEALCHRLHRTLVLVEMTKPELGRPLTNLVRRLLRGSRKLAKPKVALLHGDLHLKNVLAAPEKVSLIDLDNLILGDPYQDIASLTASLLNQALIGELDRATAQRAITLFLDRYFQQMPWSLDPAALRWHLSAALLNERLTRAISRLKAGRWDRLAEILSLADKIERGDDVLSWLPQVAEIDP